MEPTVILLAVLVIVVGIGMMWLMISGQKTDQRQRALSVISGRSGSLESKDNSPDNRDKRRSDLAKKLKQSNSKQGDKKDSILDLLQQAGFRDTPVKKYWMYSFTTAFVITLIAQLSGQSLVVVILAFIIGLFGFPRVFLRKKIARRQKKFLEEFADALESMVRLLKAGMPVGEAILMVSREFSGPVGEEMTRVYDEQKIGIPMAEACLHAAKRMPITEMQMFATGIAIQQQTGSSLSEVLLNLAKVIRARFRLKRKVQALSAEAKASAGIIGSLPVLVATGLYFINPSYIELLFITQTGKMLAMGAVTWMSIGILVMKQMINFRV